MIEFDELQDEYDKCLIEQERIEAAIFDPELADKFHENLRALWDLEVESQSLLDQIAARDMAEAA